jgi:hypothetical protein
MSSPSCFSLLVIAAGAVALQPLPPPVSDTCVLVVVAVISAVIILVYIMSDNLDQ